uniref:HEAT repeat-containing protein 1 n=1 Tax=Corethron hystrix TaxID=216773 RepID=A0A7S1BT49_9STRA
MDGERRATSSLLSTSILSTLNFQLSRPSTAKIVASLGNLKSRNNADGRLMESSMLTIWTNLLQLSCLPLRENRTTTLLDAAAARLRALLPAPYFLASVSSILRLPVPDEDDARSPRHHPAVRRKALMLLAERTAAITSREEAELFADLLPELCEVAATAPAPCSDADDGDVHARAHALVRQAALFAIERLAGSGLVSPTAMATTLLSTVTLLETLTPGVLRILQGDAAAATPRDVLEVRLWSSLALSIATLAAAAGLRALAALPRLVRPLLAATLREANAAVLRAPAPSARLLQTAALETLRAVFDTLPQFFLGPDLAALLSRTGLLSRALRDAPTNREAAGRLDALLVERSPPRILLPVLCRAVAELAAASDAEEEATVALDLVARTVASAASRADLAGHVEVLLTALFAVYAGGSMGREGKALQDAADRTLVATVMKLSESQLRKLYVRFRGWRGDVAKETDQGATAAAVRRFAFWNASAVLSDKLKGLFLSCLGVVMDDVVQELEFAAVRLCDPTAVSSKEGTKRRRLSAKPPAAAVDVLRPLSPLLRCLESALAADSRAGGDWIRAHDGRRFHDLLRPLAQLLRASVPAGLGEDVPGGSLSPHARLVLGRGSGPGGGVVGCLAALAAGGGDEKYWKPLVHAIVGACSEEGRSEVRRAGARALLDVIERLEEEFMVLLPECLPVLSEMLEDDDDDVAVAARECVQAERICWGRVSSPVCGEAGSRISPFGICMCRKILCVRAAVGILAIASSYGSTFGCVP